MKSIIILRYILINQYIYYKSIWYETTDFTFIGILEHHRERAAPTSHALFFTKEILIKKNNIYKKIETNQTSTVGLEPTDPSIMLKYPIKMLKYKSVVSLSKKVI